MATIITMAKKGLSKVVIASGIYSTGEKWYTIKVNGITTSLKSASAANAAYIQYKKAGWEATVNIQHEAEVVVETEEKVAAPKPTREDALTEKYGSKESRKEYCKKRDEIRFQVANEIREWVKTHHRLSKDQYKKVWNDEVQKRLSQWEAERVAIQG